MESVVDIMDANPSKRLPVHCNADYDYKIGDVGRKNWGKTVRGRGRGRVCGTKESQEFQQRVLIEVRMKEMGKARYRK